MSKETTKRNGAPKPYTYERNCPDGVFDRMAIVGPEGEVIANLYYWAEPDTDEAKRVEKAARIICKQLNHWWHGMDDCQVLTPEEVREHETKRVAQEKAMEGGRP